ATSDLNDLYRRIINRNNRLKHIEALRAPEVMVYNEKRLLQEAVDALIENGARGKVVIGAGNRPLKSLSDILKGKQGRFRQNLLGKRVDYSGRSVIVVGPYLKLHQCGLPKEMALELFKPFIIRELMKRDSLTLKAAKRMFDRVRPEIWDILEEVTKKHLVLLNRAPTLHRLGIQAFEPVLIEGKSIQLHPLTCAAFNADFDGDQMAVHVPLSQEAQLEARLLMLASNNVLSPASGRPIATPSHDMVFGLRFLVLAKPAVKGDLTVYASTDEVVTAYQCGKVDLQARIKILPFTVKDPQGGERLFDLYNEPVYDDKGHLKLDEDGTVARQAPGKVDKDKWRNLTTPGRVLFNEILPVGLKNYLAERFSKEHENFDAAASKWVRPQAWKANLASLVDSCFDRYGLHRTVILLDDLKALGYRFATRSGLSISIAEMDIPKIKKELVAKARQQVKQIDSQFKMGAITDAERYHSIIEVWSRVTDEISKVMFDDMKKTQNEPYKAGKARVNAVYLMTDSGARGSRQQARQLSGIRGLMQKPQKKLTGGVGEIIENPIVNSFREGLTVLEYFISTHGGRKGLTDTALKTADAGYLTRRLVDAAHDLVITQPDCGTIDSIEVDLDRVDGRVIVEDLKDDDDKVVMKAGDLVTPAVYRERIEKIVEASRTGEDDMLVGRKIRVRSVLVCESEEGVCGACYGLNNATRQTVDLGEAVGIIAAQSIGEPGTQLTLRTFHLGGAAASSKGASSAEVSGEGSVKVGPGGNVVENSSGQRTVISRSAEVLWKPAGKRDWVRFPVPYGARINFKDGQEFEKGSHTLAAWQPHAAPILAKNHGELKWRDLVENVTLLRERNKLTGLVEARVILDRGGKHHPKLELTKGDKVVETYPLPVDTLIVADDGSKIAPGDLLGSIPRAPAGVHGDITGGLPRVSELFEARVPKESSVLSEINGVVSVSRTQKGTLKITVTDPESTISKDYEIPRGKHLQVYENDLVAAGDPLTDGPVNPHDILRIQGEKMLRNFLVRQIQDVYKLQGVVISDRHIECIVRQMLRNVKVSEPGDSGLLRGEVVSRQAFQQMNAELKDSKKAPAQAEPVLLGITKASLASSSFISAASFQETTRVLTDAATSSKIDPLKGLKENVIIGHMIPAGTGLHSRLREAKAQEKLDKAGD
ncbi:DNA-directed RNA polymerase subunit beta', partial [bacterium]